MNNLSDKEFSYIQLLDKKYAKNKISEGQIVKAKILSLDKEFVLVDIGYKAEGFISINEFKSHNSTINIDIGNYIDVLVESTENDYGFMILSKEKADKVKTWENIAAAAERDELIKGIVVGRVKGGLHIDIGVKAFLPGSQVDLRPIRNLDKLIGEVFLFKVIKFNKKRGNIVLSRRALLEKKRDNERKNTLKNLEPGSIRTGIVKNITDYGAFIDLGGVDGLLHVTDMSWGRVKNPEKLFKIGDSVKVKILKYETDNERVSLGIKQIQEDPWFYAQDKFPVGTKLTGKIVSLTDYGIFIELIPGVEGLIHITDMFWTKRVKHPSKVVNIGEFVDAIVLKIDEKNKKISLGMKQIVKNPWTVLKDKYPVGTVFKGKVRNITDFGIFINIEDGIDGLVHLSDLSWTYRVKHPSEMFQKGDELEVVVLSIDAEKERFSLGIKQLYEDPWNKIPLIYSRGTKVKGKVKKVTDFGAFIEIAPGIDGLCHISEFSSEHIKDPKNFLSPGDVKDVVILDTNQEKRKIALSIKALDQIKEIEDEDQESESKLGTFGEKFKNRLLDDK